MSAPKSEEKQIWTYADYLSWPEDERWEIIHGEAFDMTPADHFKRITKYRNRWGKVIKIRNGFPPNCIIFFAIGWAWFWRRALGFRRPSLGPVYLYSYEPIAKPP